MNELYGLRNPARALHLLGYLDELLLWHRAPITKPFEVLSGCGAAFARVEAAPRAPECRRRHGSRLRASLLLYLQTATTGRIQLRAW
jgi:hypothetical protein